MIFEDVEEIEDKIEEEDYPPSEVDEYDDSSSEDENDKPKSSDDDHMQAVGTSGSAVVTVGAVKPFTGECRLLAKIEPKPCDYFLHLVDENFLTSICENTNQHATLEQEEFATLHLSELKTFLGIALHARNGINMLFDEDSFFRTRFDRLFTMSMTKNRFLEILRRLQFSPLPTEPTSLDALGNVVEYFNTKMENTYCPGRDLCIYNSVVIWRGRVICRERVARQFDGKHGIAVDELTEPNGMTLRLRVSPQALELESAGRALRTLVVEDLMRGLLDRGHALYLDPFYCSVTMARRLLARDTYCTGLLDAEDCKPSMRGRKGGVQIDSWKSGDRRYYSVTTEFMGTGEGSSRTPRAAVAAFKRASRRHNREDELRMTICSMVRMRWHKLVFFLALYALARNACALYCRYSGDSISFSEFLNKVTLDLLPVNIDDLSDDDGDVSDTDVDGARNI